MTEGRFSEEQMVAVLREAERTSVAETAKKHNVSDQTIYACRRHSGVKWFRSRAEAEVVIEAWRLHFNAIHLHSSLNYLTPLEFKRQPHPIPNAAEATSGWMFFWWIEKEHGPARPRICLQIGGADELEHSNSYTVEVAARAARRWR